jgi:hypothetical protein
MNIVHVLFSVKRGDIIDALGKSARMRNPQAFSQLVRELAMQGPEPRRRKN